MKNESQTVLTVSLSPNDEAPLTRAILCSPCEEQEEQKRQCDLHLVRLILTQLSCIGSVCSSHMYGSPLETVWWLQEDTTRNPQRRMGFCLTEVIFQVIRYFYEEKKARKIRVCGSKATNRECFYIWNIAMEIMHYYYFYLVVQLLSRSYHFKQ